MKKLFLPLCLLLLAACEGGRVETPYGEIPDGSAELAKRYVGAYKGAFRGREGKLLIGLEGNIPSLRFEGVDGRTDILGAICNSTIGNLQAIYPKKKKDGSIVLTHAEFGFDPGQCKIKGRDITLAFDHLNALPTGVEISIVERTYTDFSCDHTGGGWDRPGGPDCSFEEKPVYITGKFVKE